MELYWHLPPMGDIDIFQILEHERNIFASKPYFKKLNQEWKENGKIIT